jgi:Tol biopolymer transport system component
VLVKPSTCSHACVPLTFAWSPNGKRLLVGGAGKQTEQFLIVSAKSGRKVAIRRPRAWTEYRVIGWSSDGRTIAYLRNKRVGWNERLELFVSRSDGSGTKSLFRFASPEKDSPSASLSPDGRTIVFTTDHFDSHDPKVARVDTENGRVRVIRGLNPLLGVNPAWSPDGRTVAFPGRIVTMSANGTHRQSLGVGGDFVAWIPNGDLIIGKGARVLLSKKGQERPRLLFRLPKKQLSLYALDAATK